MVRALSRLILSVLMVAAACGRAGDGAAAGGRNDTAQQPAPAAGRDTAQARETVLRLEEELGQALVRGDPAPADRILAKDYVGVSMDGLSETKAQAVAKMRRDSATAVEAVRLDSTTVRVYGDAALALVRGTARGRSGGQPMTVPFRNTDVFVWRDGRWQIVASHVSQVAEPQGRSRTR